MFLTTVNTAPVSALEGLANYEQTVAPLPPNSTANTWRDVYNATYQQYLLCRNVTPAFATQLVFKMMDHVKHNKHFPRQRGRKT